MLPPDAYIYRAHLLLQEGRAPLSKLCGIKPQRQVLHERLDLLICRLQLPPLHLQLALQLLHHHAVFGG